MKGWGIQVANEKKMRLVAAGLTINNEAVAENGMFSFPMKSGGEELKSAAIAYIPHLKCKIFDLMEKNARSLLTCIILHIPNNYILHCRIGRTDSLGTVDKYRLMRCGLNWVGIKVAPPLR